MTAVRPTVPTTVPTAGPAAWPTDERPAPPSAARIALARVGLELRLFRRERQQMVFAFAYPIGMMVIFGSLMREELLPGGVLFPQYFLPGIAATGVLLISFQAVASAIAAERENGTLAHLQLVGVPPAAYFAGKAGQVLVATAVQLALLLPVARYGFDVPLPADAAHWLTFVWVAALGSLAGTVLGVGVSGLGGSAGSVGTTVMGLSVVLQFFSGVFFVYGDLPAWMQQAAALLPLKWMTQGLRSAVLPEQSAAYEVAGGWEHGRTALVLAAWVIIGAVICARTFRWRRADR